MTLTLKHLNKLEKQVLMPSIRSKGLKCDSFRENVDARLEACKNKDRDFFENDYSAGLFRPEVQTEDWKNLRIHHLMDVVSDRHLIEPMKSMTALGFTGELENTNTPTEELGVTLLNLRTPSAVNGSPAEDHKNSLI